MSSHPQGLSLIDVLVGNIQTYDGEQLTYWVHDPRLTEEEARENRAYIELMDNLAKALLEAELVEFKPSYDSLEITPGQLTRSTGQVRELILEKLQIDIAEDFCWRVDRAAERALEVGGLALATSPSRAVRAYLIRLARCYIFGFFPECIILCRSALENALSEMFRIHEIIPPQNLKKKIVSAAELKWLTAQEAKIAHDIRIRGNKAVHHDPHAVKQPFQTIANTLRLISSLLDR